MRRDRAPVNNHGRRPIDSAPQSGRAFLSGPPLETGGRGRRERSEPRPIGEGEGFIYLPPRPIGHSMGGTGEVWVLRLLDRLPRLEIMQRFSNEQQKLCDKQTSFEDEPL